MNRIILASHGGLSAGMKNTAEMILGGLPHVYVVATTRDEMENILSATRRLLDGFAAEDKVYILTDVLGGSVNNDMLTLLNNDPRITLLCGMNTALVLSLASQSDVVSAEELHTIVSEAREQIIDCADLLRNAQIEEDDL